MTLGREPSSSQPWTEQSSAQQYQPVSCPDDLLVILSTVYPGQRFAMIQRTVCLTRIASAVTLKSREKKKGGHSMLTSARTS